MPESKTSIQKEVLLKEYDRVCTDIRGYESYTDRIVGLGFTLLSIGMTVGVAQRVSVAFFILPVALIGVLAYAIMNARWVRELGAYKGYLEDKINALCGEEVLLWEKLVLLNVGANSSFVVLWVVYVVVSIAIFYVSLVQIGVSYGAPYEYAMAVVLLLLGAIFFRGVLELIKVPSDAKARIAETLSEPKSSEPN